MAKRKDIQGARLEEVELPTPPQISLTRWRRAAQH